MESSRKNQVAKLQFIRGRLTWRGLTVRPSLGCRANRIEAVVSPETCGTNVLIGADVRRLPEPANRSHTPWAPKRSMLSTPTQLHGETQPRILIAALASRRI